MTVSWWLSGNIPVANCVGAWQAKGAASYAASLLDLSGSGNNLTAAGSPNWESENGWLTDGIDDSFDTGLTPSSGWTIIIRYANHEHNWILMGEYRIGARLDIFDRITANFDVLYGSGGSLTVKPALGSGCLAIAGNQGYRNGVADGAAISAWTTTANATIMIGDEGGNEGLRNRAHIFAAAVYNTTLTPAQVYAVSEALKDVGYSGIGRFGTVLSGTGVRQPNVIEPTVIYDTNPVILTSETNVYKMWYTGYIYTVSADIYYAESKDGIYWTKYTVAGVVTAVKADHARSCVTKVDDTYYLFATDHITRDKIDIYSSTNGIDFSTVVALNIFPLVPGSWESTTFGNIWAWREAVGDWRMIYEALGPSVWALGYATSTDGITWTKYASNPVITGVGCAGGAYVKKTGGTYYLWAHTAVTGNIPTDFSLFTSQDCITWTANPSNPVFVRTSYDEGPGAMPEAQLGDVCFVEEAGNTGKVLMFYEALRTQATRAHIKMAKFDDGFIETGIPRTYPAITKNQKAPVYFFDKPKHLSRPISRRLRK